MVLLELDDQPKPLATLLNAVNCIFKTWFLWTVCSKCFFLQYVLKYAAGCFVSIKWNIYVPVHEHRVIMECIHSIDISIITSITDNCVIMDLLWTCYSVINILHRICDLRRQFSKAHVLYQSAFVEGVSFQRFGSFRNKSLWFFLPKKEKHEVLRELQPKAFCAVSCSSKFIIRIKLYNILTWITINLYYYKLLE